MSSEEDSTRSYRIKDIKFFGSARRILLQSANGPCPLLAICNVLLLRNQLAIPEDARYISFTELVGMVSDHLFSANAEGTTGGGSETTAANVRENLSSCLEILPRLNVGLDVNCKFSGPSDFEYTQEMAVFDLFDIEIYHGWIVSKQDAKAHAAIAHLSYNQLVERLIAFEEAQQPAVSSSAEASATPVSGTDANDGNSEGISKTIEDGRLIKEFMSHTATQLSYDGLLALHEVVRERQLAVFFRNSHFSTMLKYCGALYLLCTDIAFAASHVLWERLDEVDGDTSYCNADFEVNTAASDEAAALAAAEAVQESYLASVACLPEGAALEGNTQEDLDAMLAAQLMQEDLQDQFHGQAQVASTGHSGARGQPTIHAKGGGRGRGTGGGTTVATQPAPKLSKSKRLGKACTVQ